MPQDSTPKCSYTLSIRTRLGRQWATQQGISLKTRFRVHCPGEVCREIDGHAFCRVHFKLGSYDTKKAQRKNKKRSAPQSAKFRIDPYYDSPEWRSLRLAVLKRDEHICQYCGAKATQADHVIPRKKGGADAIKNLVACCAPCNKTAANNRFPTFREKKAFVLSHRPKQEKRPTPELDSWNRDKIHNLEKHTMSH